MFIAQRVVNLIQQRYQYLETYELFCKQRGLFLTSLMFFNYFQWFCKKTIVSAIISEEN